MPAITELMEKTVLPRSRLEVSRIGLGLAHVHLLSTAVRDELLRRALDLGITHFDTARLYADGLSEIVLGKAVRGIRDKVTITSKFGLRPWPFIGSLGPAAWPVRKGRSVLDKLGIYRYPQRSYTRATLRQSLQASLRALRTDYIDIYSIHEPEAHTTITEDVFEELERSKQRGDIRFIGVSGGRIDSIVARFGAHLDVVQSDEASWDESRFVPDITHSLFSGQSPVAAGEDPVRRCLLHALGRRRTGAVIVQTRQTRHLEQIAAWACGK